MGGLVGGVEEMRRSDLVYVYVCVCIFARVHAHVCLSVSVCVSLFLVCKRIEIKMDVRSAISTHLYLLIPSKHIMTQS